MAKFDALLRQTTRAAAAHELFESSEIVRSELICVLRTRRPAAAAAASGGARYRHAGVVGDDEHVDFDHGAAS